MNLLYKTLVKISNAIFSIEKWILLIAVIVAVGVNFLNVILRYILKQGISSCEMLSIVLFMFMVVIGGNIAIKTDDEIRIDVFHSNNKRKNAAFRLFSDIISILALILSIIGLVATVQTVMLNKQKVTPLPIYTYHIYIFMTVGFAMMLLDHIIIFIQHIMTIAGKPVDGGLKTE